MKLIGLAHQRCNAVLSSATSVMTHHRARPSNPTALVASRCADQDATGAPHNQPACSTSRHRRKRPLDLHATLALLRFRPARLGTPPARPHPAVSDLDQ